MPSKTLCNSILSSSHGLSLDASPPFCPSPPPPTQYTRPPAHSHGYTQSPHISPLHTSPLTTHLPTSEMLLLQLLSRSFVSDSSWSHGLQPRDAAAAAKSLQSWPTLCDPRDGSPWGSPSLGFSRQEHWSGLPFPSPTHESEKWKRSRSVVSDSLRPHGLQPTRLLHAWDFPGKSTGVGSSK